MRCIVFYVIEIIQANKVKTFFDVKSMLDLMRKIDWREVFLIDLFVPHVHTLGARKQEMRSSRVHNQVPF